MPRETKKNTFLLAAGQLPSSKIGDYHRETSIKRDFDDFNDFDDNIKLNKK